MSRTMKEQLGSIFVNNRGEICASDPDKNVSEDKARKKSVVDKDHRAQRGAAKKKLIELKGEERALEQKIKSLRSEGLSHGAGTEICAKFFAEANDVNNELRGVRKNIRRFSKKVK